LPSAPLRPVLIAPPSPPSMAWVVVAPKVDSDGILTVSPSPAASKVAPARPVESARPTPTNCSPPYYFDELGLKIFKPECVN
jgi:hypothetical protein